MLLSQYYRLEEATGGRQADPSNIDSQAFQPDAFYAQLLAKTPLKQLSSMHNDLASEVTSLDRNLQKLVYENYNRFITASETIQRMKTNVDQADVELSHLTETMDKLQTSTDTVTDGLAERRARIVELTGVHRLLKRLQFLYELPVRLKHCLTTCAFDQAVAYWRAAEPILTEHESVASFGSLKQRCQTIMTDIGNRIRARMVDESSSTADVGAAMRLLLDMHGAEEELRVFFRESREQRLFAALDQLEADLAETPAESLEALILFLRDRVVLDLVEFANVFRSLFVERADAADPEAARAALAGVMESAMHRYIKQVEIFVQSEPAVASSLLDGLEGMFRDADVVSQYADKSVLAAAVETLHTAMKACIEQALVASHAALLQAMDVVKDDLSRGDRSALASSCGNVARAFVTETEKQLTDLSLFHTHESPLLAKHRDDFVTMLRRMLGDALQRITGVLLTDANVYVTKTTSKTAGLFLAFLAQLLLTMESDTLPGLSCAFVRIFPRKYAVQEGLALDDLSITFKDAAQSALSSYVAHRARAVSSMIRRNVLGVNWVTMAEPRGVRMGVNLVVKVVLEMQRDLNWLFGQQHDAADITAADAAAGPIEEIGAVIGHAGKDEIELTMARLFAKKVKVFTTPEFSASSVITCVVKIALKTFIECVRVRTFARNGFQQVQLDAQYLCVRLSPVVSDPAALSSLLDEVYSSTRDRCTDPVPLEPSVVASVLRKSLGRSLSPAASAIAARESPSLAAQSTSSPILLPDPDVAEVPRPISKLD